MSKNVLIINLDKSGDKEITEMCQAIKIKKKKKKYQAKVIECKGDLNNFKIKVNMDVTQIVIGAHSRYFDGNNISSPAQIKPFQPGQKDSRHFGEYAIKEIAELITKALNKYPSLKEVKFYACESAITKKTTSRGFLKKTRSLRLNPNMDKKKVNNMIVFSISHKTLSRYQSIMDQGIKDKKEFAKLSNLEILITEISKHFQSQSIKKRHVFFQGLNGIGYFDPANMKTATFNQEDLHKLKLFGKDKKKDIETFEAQCVQGKKTVDKIGFKVGFGQ